MAEEAPQDVPAPAEAAPEAAPAAPMAASAAISVDPLSIQVSASGGHANINVQNNNPGARYAFKVKSTNNDHYRVNPVYGFVESGAAAQVEVTRLSGPAKADDRLEILFQSADGGLADPKTPFVGGAAPEHKQEVTLIAE